MRHFIYTILFLLGVYINYAQQIQPVFKHYALNEGLASSETYQCYQDSYGFIWIATNNGVSRFDGNSFRNYNMENGIPDNTVLYIVGEDKKQIVWFVSMAMDLFGIDISGKIYLNPATSEIKKHFKSGANIYPSIADNGDFYINLISDGSCMKIDKNNKTSFIARPISTTQINLLKTSSRFMPQLSYNRAYRKINQITIVAVASEQDFRFTKSMYANHMYRFDYCKNNLYASAHNKIFVYNKSKLCFDSLEIKGRIIDFYVDKDTNLLVSTHQNGIYFFKKSQLKNKPLRFLSIKSIGRIIQDTDGGYWIPTLNNGLYYLRSIYHKSIVFKEDDQYNSVDKMAVGKKDVLFSVSNGKLFYFINDTIKEIKDKELKEGRKPIFQSMHYDKLNNRYMVSIDDPSVRLVQNGKIINKQTNNIGAFLSYTYCNNKMYVGTWTNIRETDSELLKASTTTIKGNEVKMRADALYTYSTDSILIGSMDGLYVYCPSKQSVTNLSDQNLLLGDRIRQIVDYENYLLLATKNKGIIVLPKHNFKSAKNFDKKNGLTSNYVYSINIHNKEIWIATNNGINRFKGIEDILNYKRPKNYNVSDGLISNEILNVAVLNDKVFLNSNQGLSILNLNALDSLEKTKHEPKIVITEIKTDSIVYKLDSVVTLENKYDYISIGFSGFYYKDPTKVIYKYKLEGYDEDWRITKNQFADYSNVFPGTFSFKLAVSVDGGNVWYNAAPLKLNLEPKLFQTIWFKLSVIIALAYLGYRFFIIVVFKNKLRKLKKMRGQIRLNNVELKALRAQMNPHFIFNVISSIQHYILENDSKSAYKYLSTFAKLMRNVLNNSEAKDVLLKDEINWLNQYIELERMRFKERFEFSLYVDEKINQNHVYMPSMILQPIIENAIKHGVSGLNYKGKIEVSFVYETGNIKISVIDNGSGINAIAKVSNEEHKSMASKIVRDRISIYNDISGFEKLKMEVFNLSEYNPSTTGTKVTISIKQKTTE